jgi:transcriptional regulator with XRE-family HTH domain
MTLSTSALGRTIRQARRRRGLTQTELGGAAATSLATVQNIEAGRANPSLSTLQRVLDALQLDLSLAQRGTDWDALVALALPLSTRSDSTARRTSFDQLPTLIRSAASEVASQGEGSRERDALEALLLALHIHYASLYRSWFADSPVVGALLPTSPTGRHIKLARIARARLAEQL